MNAKIPRVFLIDVLRVFAIVMMIAYHFCYDLKYFGWTSWTIPDGDGWRYWRYVIVSLFVFTMGASMGLATAHGRNYRAFYKRLSKIAVCAFIITIMSLVMFAKSWIYFGILHFMAVASCFVFLLSGVNWKLTMIIGIGILIGFFMGWLPRRWPFDFISTLPGYTEDFVPLFPWLGVACIGLAFSQIFRTSEYANRNLTLEGSDNRMARTISVTGKRSLLIYMIHQPILFAVLICAGWLIR